MRPIRRFAAILPALTALALLPVIQGCATSRLNVRKGSPATVRNVLFRAYEGPPRPIFECARFYAPSADVTNIYGIKIEEPGQVGVEWLFAPGARAVPGKDLKRHFGKIDPNYLIEVPPGKKCTLLVKGGRQHSFRSRAGRDYGYRAVGTKADLDNIARGRNTRTYQLGEIQWGRIALCRLAYTEAYRLEDGKWVRDLRTCPGTFTYPDGTPANTVDIVEGIAVREASYYRNGQMAVEFTMENGVYHGPYRKWYRNGQLKEEGTYRGFNRQGLVTRWYENGNRKEEATYVDNRVSGPVTLWYENGNKRAVYEMHEKGFYDRYSLWNEDGTPFEGETELEYTYRGKRHVANAEFRNGRHCGVWGYSVVGKNGKERLPSRDMSW